MPSENNIETFYLKEMIFSREKHEEVHASFEGLDLSKRDILKVRFD